MKDRRFLLIRWVCVLLVLLCSSHAALADIAIYTGMSKPDAYEKMVRQFELKEYEAAAQLIEEYGLAESDYRDAKLYQHYCGVGVCMENGNVEEAVLLLRGLKETNPKFYDCEAFYYYAEGRLAQQQKKYEAAMEHYAKAAHFRDAAQRSLDCRQLLEDQRRAQAEEYFTLGVETKNTDALQQAAQLYSLLDDAGMEALCRDAIVQIEDEKALENAILVFESAVKQKNVDMLQESYRFFSSRTDEKSQELAKQCKAEIDKINRSMTAQVTGTSVTGLDILIQDTMSSSQTYTVVYGPVNNQPVQMQVTEKTVRLEGLLPDTEYSITIAAEGLQDTPVTLMGKTEKAKPYSENGFSVTRRRLMGIDDGFLQIKTLEEIWMQQPEIVDLYDDYSLNLKNEILSYKPYSYYYRFTIQQTEATTQPVTVRWLIRSQENGVVVSETEQYDGLPRTGDLELKMNPLLDALYANKNSWPALPCVVEVYINDHLAGEGMLTIQKE